MIEKQMLRRQRRGQRKKPVKLTPEQLHGLISEQIQKQTDTIGWQNKKSIAARTGHSLQNLYHQALNKKIDGKSFFGHESWQAYLENHHGINSLSNKHMPDERIHTYIGHQIKKGIPMNSGYWRKYKQTAFPLTGQSLHALYMLARQRKKNGKGFFGHESWKTYLEQQHNYHSNKL
ncbi:MAG: hypothetical protein Q7K42_00935, partial [Candidatus Diapherotrites archaeon]|nr:hypothetical protein [Candidatus Diapherotrites archaeon]